MMNSELILFKKSIYLCDRGESIFIASIINKSGLESQYTNPADLYLLSFEFLVERFNSFCKETNEFGMIQIEQSNNDLKKKLSYAPECFLSDGTSFQKIEVVTNA